MFKHTPPDTLERVARAMCIADHNDPDRKVARYIQEHLNGMAQHKTDLPVEQHCVPAWHLYTHLVPAAIEALEPIPIQSRIHHEDVAGVIEDDGTRWPCLKMSYDPVGEMKQLGLSYERLAADILNEPFENEAKRNVDFLALNKELSS